MIRQIRLVFLVLLGTTFTFSASTVGWRLLLSVLAHPEPGCTGGTFVRVENHRLLYFSDGNVLIFPIESSGTELAPPSIVRIPEERRWAIEMPHWSRRKRSEVVDDLKCLTTPRHMKIVESSDGAR